MAHWHLPHAEHVVVVVNLSDRGVNCPSPSVMIATAELLKTCLHLYHFICEINNFTDPSANLKKDVSIFQIISS